MSLIAPITAGGAGSRPRPTQATLDAGRAFRLRIYAALIVGDVTAIVGAFLLMGVLTLGNPIDRWVINDLAVLLPIHFGIAVQRKPYSARFFQNWRRTTRDTVAAMLTAMATTFVIVSYLHASVDLSYRLLVAGGLLAAALMVLLRWRLHRFADRRTGGHYIATMLVIDGMPHPDVTELPAIDVSGMGLDVQPVPHDALGRFSEAVAHAERIVVACPPARRAAWTDILRGANVQGEVLIPEWETLGAQRLSQVAGRQTAVLSTGPLDTRNRLHKRVFDLIVAGLAILILSPVLLATAIAIKLDSRGPVLFRQPRVGRGNRLFQVLKFRSMRVDASDIAGDRSTERGDPRITRVGRIIRATSVDELPQLLNVLRGDMSIVGPRPHALGSLAGDRLFWDAEPRYWQRHAIKPGITGLAQVRGFRGATERVDDLAGRVDSDLDYIRGWSILRDVRIVLMTIGVLVHPNAF